MRSHGIKLPGTEARKPWDLLREIAEGQATLNDPGGAAAKHPQMREYIARVSGIAIRKDRDLAARILEGFTVGREGGVTGT